MLCQGLGELLSTGFSLSVPGPVIGMACLLVVLLLREKIDTDLATVAASFSQHLGLLFVPAAVGVVSFLPVLSTHGWAVALVLLLSVAITIVTTALVLRFLSPEITAAESDEGSGKSKPFTGQ